ncbi:hypothetical protein ACFOQM_10545 [Paenibacillus sp. GCM10012307]|uniref:Uncharacterized protein n=1 Tax=Paenibacillus roseus TaxID=2798579 RepID=A0A934MP55_9BACL|nr:hypothetical protein [Paenibacillus roseus]MBJ6361721.1 hypothetical protein [Paenibacillus roseus]
MSPNDKNSYEPPVGAPVYVYIDEQFINKVQSLYKYDLIHAIFKNLKQDEQSDYISNIQHVAERIRQAAYELAKQYASKQAGQMDHEIFKKIAPQIVGEIAQQFVSEHPKKIVSVIIKQIFEDVNKYYNPYVNFLVEDIFLLPKSFKRNTAHQYIDNISDQIEHPNAITLFLSGDENTTKNDAGRPEYLGTTIANLNPSFIARKGAFIMVFISSLWQTVLTLTHELAHLYKIPHNSDPHSIMYGSYKRGRNNPFNSAEQAVLKSNRARYYK